MSEGKRKRTGEKTRIPSKTPLVIYRRAQKWYLHLGLCVIITRSCVTEEREREKTQRSSIFGVDFRRGSTHTHTCI